MAAKGRRSPAPGGRPNSVMVALSDAEKALVSAASVREGLSAGAWLGEVGVRTAEAAPSPAAKWGPLMQDLMSLRAELMDGRRLLRNIGGNLNDVARHANATGEIHQATSRVEARVAEAVERLDQTVRQIDERIARARHEQLRVQR